MIETATVTVLDTQIGEEEAYRIESLRTKQELQDCMKNGFRIKFVTSCVLGSTMLIHYVLEKESNFNEIKKKGNCETCENYAGKTTTFDDRTDYLCKLGGWYCNTEGCESYKEKK